MKKDEKIMLSRTDLALECREIAGTLKLTGYRCRMSKKETLLLHEFL